MNKTVVGMLFFAGSLAAGSLLGDPRRPERPATGNPGEHAPLDPDGQDSHDLRPPVLSAELRKALAGRFQPGSVYGRVSTTSPSVEGRLHLVYYAPKKVSFSSWLTPFGPAASGSAVQVRLKAPAGRPVLVACAVHAVIPVVDPAAAEAAAVAAAQAKALGLPPPAPLPTDFVLATGGATTTTPIQHGAIGWVSAVLQPPSDAWQDVRITSSGDWNFLFCEAVNLE